MRGVERRVACGYIPTVYGTSILPSQSLVAPTATSSGGQNVVQAASAAAAAAEPTGLSISARTRTCADSAHQAILTTVQCCIDPVILCISAEGCFLW